MTATPAMGSEHVRIYEVGPRDGLQNEPAALPLETKATFIGLLADAGLREIEATSFVAPRAIPQLADADALMTGFGSDRLADGARVALLAGSAAGVGFSIYLTFLEPFVIGATCMWCLGSAVIITLLLWLTARPGVAAWRRCRAFGNG